MGVAYKVGSLEVGKYTDFLIVDPGDPDTGPLWNPIGTYVLACGLHNLKAVYVGGQCVSRDGRSTYLRAAEASRDVTLGIFLRKYNCLRARP